ncbi:MAG: Asp-tRNA(Asn)/Glu-tRNA(Gln) amidotransferase subunit GatB [Deltaproteobacteria bacterium]|nr:Asp-tRNA(Asn)/Glu-tRNA(Gln) amidotransferase subunit GatB [Deltaproteobacteria bacterium]
MSNWETVVGLEVHVQLKTATKLFSPAPVRFGQAPNVDVDATDAGLPGALPVLNQEAVSLALKVGLALGSTIRRRSVFTRKHYFYPDLPKGYQITQSEAPILEGGALSFVVDDATAAEKTVELVRAHLEEDAGKSMHADDGTRLDWNRSGTPLLEVVTTPSMSSGEEAMRFFRALRSIVVALEVCDGNLQEGSMRADANVSVRRPGAPLGTRVELKNINSPRNLHDAVVDEARRQIALINGGAAVVQETRLWDADRAQSRSMRSKEDAPDYRYFPDPDLPVVVVDEARIERARASMPELPGARAKRYVEAFGLAQKQAAVVVNEPELTAYFETALKTTQAGREKSVANWLVNEVLGLDDGLARVRPAQLARLVALVEDGALAGKSGKELVRTLTSDDDVDAVVDARGLRLQQGGAVDDAVRAVVRQVFADNPTQVAGVKAGKDKLKGFLVGQSMKKLSSSSVGAVDPKRVQQIVDEELS